MAYAAMMVDVWVLSAGRTGDLRQMSSVADALGWPHTVIDVRFRKAGNGRIAFQPHKYLDGGNPFETGKLPDLVICAEAGACALAAHAKRSGKRFKLVCIGRPRGYFTDFDLIITSPQYRLDRMANAVELPVAPHEVPAVPQGEVPEVLRKTGGEGLTVVLAGGSSPPDVFGIPAARELASVLNQRVKDSGERIVIVTSPRTPLEVVKGLEEMVAPGVSLSPWRAGEESVYPHALAQGDAFVVTSDSVSMTAEALLTGKPVTVYKLPQVTSRANQVIEVLSGLRMARFLFDRGLLETRPDRGRLFALLASRYGLQYDGQAAAGQIAKLPRTASHAAQLIRSLVA